MKNQIVSNNPRRTFNHEIERAQAAYLIGNQGMARVCARRAAGIVAGVYLELRMGLKYNSPSVLKKLQTLKECKEIKPETKTIINHFLLHTDTHHNLPLDINLIDDATYLASILLEWD